MTLAAAAQPRNAGVDGTVLGDDQAPLAHLQRQLDRFGQSTPRLAHAEPVDDHFDVVTHLAVEL